MAKTTKAKTPLKAKKKKPVVKKVKESDSAEDLSAAQFVKRLKLHRSADEVKKIQRYFKSEAGDYSESDEFIGVRMGQVFALAKEFMDMPVTEIEKL
jgi:hypothetical protein